MAVLQIVVLVGGLYFEALVVTKKLVARGDQNIVTAERNAAQTPVGATALEINIALVPVDMLHNLLFLKIYRIYTAVTLALPAATYDGCCDERW